LFAVGAVPAGNGSRGADHRSNVCTTRRSRPIIIMVSLATSTSNRLPMTLTAVERHGFTRDHARVAISALPVHGVRIDAVVSSVCEPIPIVRAPGDEAYTRHGSP
jgi:hypothetical protein